MSKYYKAEDVIRKYAEMIADEAYWEHGVGNGKPDEEDLDIAREYYSDLPTIDVVHCKDCKHYAEHNELYINAPTNCVKHSTINHYVAVNVDDFCSYGERKDNE